jgi:hypothetical protein
MRALASNSQQQSFPAVLNIVEDLPTPLSARTRGEGISFLAREMAVHRPPGIVVQTCKTKT